MTFPVLLESGIFGLSSGVTGTASGIGVTPSVGSGLIGGDGCDATTGTPICAAPQPVTQAERLAPYRKSILKQRRRGLDWQQIAAGMALPPIAERVSVRVLKQVFGVEEDVPNASPGKPAARLLQLVLDPVTGQPVGPLRPPFRPMCPKEHEQFDRLLQGLIPPIVKVKMTRTEARSYANNAVEMMRPKDAARLHEILEVELDNLTEANCAQCGVPPEEIAPWRRKFSLRENLG